jgi:hypothetical protein
MAANYANYAKIRVISVIRGYLPVWAKKEAVSLGADQRYRLSRL